MSTSSSDSLASHAELVLRAVRDEPRETSVAMAEAREHFGKLQAGLHERGKVPLALLASLGERMSQARVGAKPLQRETVQAMLREIVELIDRQTSEPPRPSLARVQLAAPTAPSSLTLRDSRRLGEILVRLSMLDLDQVENALRVQRATGKRLGEALMELKLISPGTLGSALRFQHNQRVASRNGR